MFPNWIKPQKHQDLTRVHRNLHIHVMGAYGFFLRRRRKPNRKEVKDGGSPDRQRAQISVWRESVCVCVCNS